MKVLIIIIVLLAGIILGIGLVEDYYNNPLLGCHQTGVGTNDKVYQCRTNTTYYVPN